MGDLRGMGGLEDDADHDHPDTHAALVRHGEDRQVGRGGLARGEAEAVMRQADADAGESRAVDDE